MQPFTHSWSPAEHPSRLCILREHRYGSSLAGLEDATLKDIEEFQDDPQDLHHQFRVGYPVPCFGDPKSAPVDPPFGNVQSSPASISDAPTPKSRQRGIAERIPVMREEITQPTP